ncbi:uncharacterized protein LOC125542332 [Triticum urartu]|uniref:uncharacterized protein LOC125542332 n=1 Tax=Triticum urartu TaxID=4572 RepID=UPI002044B6E9|nr:uncharacterized protein LOC125542332 [Triticum urartu]XP_048561277.1 uncharacterized protein LOC125542332 [Triticum urartu]XP_048561278.1 uncharacterized protein LOC125542332 [Triticum urartu]XP_048561279.1 uncharacterized protein LOC125542332 [Triticum urartu]XP_048561280.1 uncharacterized protein LOC125542332 [Triticum urartu]XP_048561281.1 uncharacterized protein LOC125542332 [Triticum urartu]
MKVPCPYAAYGCRTRVAYCLAADHQLECPHAPCRCPEPDCLFLGSPPALSDHLALHHHWLVTTITFGKAHPLEMQATERRRLLAAEDPDEGEHLFLLVASERAGGERAVKVVCVRGSTGAGPWMNWCKLWTIPPMDPENGGRSPVLIMEDWARSCAVISEEAAVELGGRYLTVPPMDMQPGGSVRLRVRIDKYCRQPDGLIQSRHSKLHC